jgi:KaiC/GvpD/RAD55 family RecA-like ATPase
VAEKAKPSVERYAFDPGFERAVVYYVCSRPGFFGRVGHALDVDALDDEAGKIAIQAAQAIADENGKGPSSSAIVLQRLRRWSREGRTTIDQIHAVAALLDAAEDDTLPTEDDVAGEVVPILKRRRQRLAVDQAIEEYAKRGDFSAVREAIVESERLGEVDVTPGSRALGEGGVVEIEALSTMQYLSTGIQELDAQLSGGLPRAQLGVAVGGPGDGKSMFLNHVFCTAIRLGLNAAYASLELPESHCHARILANASNTPINDVIEGNGARRALAHVQGEQAKGRWNGQAWVKFFTPQGTTVEDLRRWLDTIAVQGNPVQVLIVDYADKMISLRSRESSEYQAMRDVYEGLRLLAIERNHWSWTASQAKKKERTSKKMSRDVESMADSMHKGRVADMVITLNAEGEETDLMSMFVAKNRTGKSRFTVGPLPTDFAFGRLVVP